MEAAMTDECFATCSGTLCPKFFYCVQHWGEPEEPNIGEGEL